MQRYSSRVNEQKGNFLNAPLIQTLPKGLANEISTDIVRENEYCMKLVILYPYKPQENMQ